MFNLRIFHGKKPPLNVVTLFRIPHNLGKRTISCLGWWLFENGWRLTAIGWTLRKFCWTLLRWLDAFREWLEAYGDWLDTSRVLLDTPSLVGHFSRIVETCFSVAFRHFRIYTHLRRSAPHSFFTYSSLYKLPLLLKLKLLKRNLQYKITSCSGNTKIIVRTDFGGRRQAIAVNGDDRSRSNRVILIVRARTNLDSGGRDKRHLIEVRNDRLRSVHGYASQSRGSRYIATPATKLEALLSGYAEREDRTVIIEPVRAGCIE